ncbi:hypothetical protein PoB_005753300 [Plakobranchus ocellatus]|uniref:SWIM-type domain-containing protein n=1 Tax=Plakobranchus ocellatus TaxID=259542 RepID=A0AAV4CGF6_9GAST|nr:hypothetical protein PoB_005753300 [Plakobranchus ocellatus]
MRSQSFDKGYGKSSKFTGLQRMAKAEELLYVAAAFVELDELECAAVAVEAARESVEPTNYKDRRFDLTQLSNTECCAYFRFNKPDIYIALRKPFACQHAMSLILV